MTHNVQNAAHVSKFNKKLLVLTLYTAHVFIIFGDYMKKKDIDEMCCPYQQNATLTNILTMPHNFCIVVFHVFFLIINYHLS